MGKVKATELIETRVDFVSLVERGANGQKFEIFKSADYKDTGKEKESIVLNEEEASFFKKFVEFFKKSKEEEMDNIEKDEAKEILDKLKELASQVAAIEKRLSAMEKQLSEGKEKGDGQIEETTKEKDTDPAPAAKTEDGKVEGASGDKGVAKEDDKNTEIMKEMGDTVKSISELLEGVNERLGKIEKTRASSNAISDNGKPVEKQDSAFAGIF